MMHQHAPLLIDVAGTALSADDCRRLAHPLVGGVTLFGRNWTDREQLIRLCTDIKRIRPDLLVAVDHEGGRVQRFRTDGFTHLPPMGELGRLWGQKGKPGALPADGALKAMNAATACGYVMAAELRACGVDLSFAPVLDVERGVSQVIGDRAFGGDPQVIAALAQAFMHGMRQAGMSNCGKHFPGHGFVEADSHHAIPVDKRSLVRILADDASPYAWLSASLDAVMPAHVIYSRVDGRPAGFSPVWLQQILRGRLGFHGVIFSDDLSMAAARQIEGRQVSFAEAALAALSAGVDVVVVCNQSVVEEGAPLDDMIDALSRLVVEGRWVPNSASEERRRRLFPVGPAPVWDELMVSERYMSALSLIP